MAFFSRFKRPETGEDLVLPQIPVLLPRINQRVTVSRGGEMPQPSRVDDELGDELVLASPTIPLYPGDPIVVTWEEEDQGWYSFETSVQRADEDGSLPTVSVSKYGRVSRYSDRRGDMRQPLSLPVELRVVIARVVKPGRELETHTVELSANALRFTTSAPFAPGDVMEARITLGPSEVVSARIKVIRLDSVSGSWRQHCTATFDDILPSDKTRIIDFLDRSGSASYL